MKAKHPCIFCGKPTRTGVFCCVAIVDDRSTRAYRRLREHVLAVKGTQCHLCGEDGADTVDHVVPIAMGGRSTFDNLEPAHKSCNSSRGMTMERGTYGITSSQPELTALLPPVFSVDRPGGRAIFDSGWGGEPAPPSGQNPGSGAGVTKQATEVST